MVYLESIVSECLLVVARGPGKYKAQRGAHFVALLNTIVVVVVVRAGVVVMVIDQDPEIPISDCTVYWIMAVKCCKATSVKIFFAWSHCRWLGISVTLAIGCTSAAFKSTTKKVTPDAKDAKEAHKSRLQDGAYSRSFTDWEEIAGYPTATDKNIKSAAKQRLEGLAKDFADYLFALALNFELCQLFVKVKEQSRQSSRFGFGNQTGWSVVAVKDPEIYIYISFNHLVPCFFESKCPFMSHFERCKKCKLQRFQNETTLNVWSFPRKLVPWAIKLCTCLWRPRYQGESTSLAFCRVRSVAGLSFGGSSGSVERKLTIEQTSAIECPERRLFGPF